MSQKNSLDNNKPIVRASEDVALTLKKYFSSYYENVLIKIYQKREVGGTKLKSISYFSCNDTQHKFIVKIMQNCV